jgi:hypothetical protein
MISKGRLSMVGNLVSRLAGLDQGPTKCQSHVFACETFGTNRYKDKVLFPRGSEGLMGWITLGNQRGKVVCLYD